MWGDSRSLGAEWRKPRGGEARGGKARGGKGHGGEARGGEARGGKARVGEARGGKHIQIVQGHVGEFEELGGGVECKERCPALQRTTSIPRKGRDPAHRVVHKSGTPQGETAAGADRTRGAR
eukprot:gene12206-biopygen13998